VVAEEEIQRVLELEPQLSFPFELGLFFKRPGTRRWSSTWHWRPEDKNRFIQLGQNLEHQGLVSQTVFVSPATGANEELKSIRLAAARHGVEAVLVISGVADTDRYNNALGPAYALLLTAFFVPGTVIDTLFVSHAGLWDVRNGFLYASVEADGRSSQTRPAFLARTEVVVEGAKVESLRQLAEAMSQSIQALVK